jgi:hypothetical protein
MKRGSVIAVLLSQACRRGSFGQSAADKHRSRTLMYYFRDVPRWSGLLSEVNLAEDDTGRRAFKFHVFKFAYRPLYILYTQSHELMIALSWRRLALSYQVIHGICADRTRYAGLLIHHRE